MTRQPQGSPAWRWPAIGLAIVAFSLAVTLTGPAWPAVAASAGGASAALPKVQHDDELYAVSCVPKRGCLAAGKWFDVKAQSTSLLAEVSAGGSWALRNPPSPKGSTVAAINGVSCVPAGCLAVGQWGTFTFSDYYAAFWNWSRWKLLTPPDSPSSALDQLDAVSCTSASFCVATGHFLNTKTHTGQASSLIWNGKSWAKKSVPLHASATDEWLYGVSCPSRSFCLAVGDYSVGGITQPTLAQTWNGSAWKIRPSQTVAGSEGSSLSAVSCRSASTCQAVGDYLTSGFAFASLGESWNGSKLTIRPTPDTGPSGESQLRGVSCISAPLCISTGDMSARWNGTGWTSVPFPLPSKIFSFTYATSCVSGSNCVAVGDYTVSATSTLVWFARWNGSSWTRQTGPSPN